MLDVRYGPKARWIRAGLFANLCLFGSGASIWAETYVCQLKVAKSERAVLPSSIRIVWPKYLEPARITDTITKLYGHKRVMTQIPVETKKKVVFRWRFGQYSIFSGA